MGYLDRIPKFVLSLIVVLGTLLAWYLTDPPKTLCDIQVDSIRSKLNKKFLRGKEDGWSYRAGIKKHYDFCLQTNSLGGCTRFLNRMDFYEKMIRSIPSECLGHPSISKFEVWFVRGFKIMSMVAWGEEPPEVEADVPGFLDERYIALYCRLASEHRRLYGDENHNKVVKSLAMNLPGIDKVPRSQRRKKTIFGLSCQRYK